MTVPGPIDFILHIDVHLGDMIATYGPFVYAVLFAIVFCETGLVFTPFLPGDSLLFAAGAFAARGDLSVLALYVLLLAAAILGDMSNYWIGRLLGPRLLAKEDSRILKKEYLDRTRGFFQRHGGKTIVLARFVPIVRTFAPFVAGVGRMHYPRFLAYNVAGGALWVGGFVTLGYFFGNIPAVEENFTLAILAIVALSLLPGVWHWAQDRAVLRRGEEPHAGGSESLDLD